MTFGGLKRLVDIQSSRLLFTLAAMLGCWDLPDIMC